MSISVVRDIWLEFLKIAKEEAGSRVVETWFKAVSLQRWDPAEKIVSFASAQCVCAGLDQEQLYALDRAAFKALAQC